MEILYTENCAMSHVHKGTQNNAAWWSHEVYERAIDILHITKNNFIINNENLEMNCLVHMVCFSVKCYAG